MSKTIYLIRESPYNENFLVEGYARNEDEVKQLIKRRRDCIFLETKSIEVSFRKGIVEVVDEDGMIYYYYITEMEPIVNI